MITDRLHATQSKYKGLMVAGNLESKSGYVTNQTSDDRRVSRIKPCNAGIFIAQPGLAGLTTGYRGFA